MILDALIFGYGISLLGFVLTCSIYLGVIKLIKLTNKNQWE